MKTNKFLLVFSFIACLFVATSCNNSGKNAASENAEKTEEAVPFSKTVADYDSTWKDRMAQLDKSIDQWEEGSKRYKGSLYDRMQKHLNLAKKQRDSLNEKLASIKDQTESGWQDFKKSVRDQYSNAVESMKEVGEELKKEE